MDFASGMSDLASVPTGASLNDLEPQSTKEGLFEWIVGFEGIAPYLQPLYTGVQNQNVSTLPSLDTTIYKQNVLVIGCGTSALSQCIADYRPTDGKLPLKDAFRAGRVVSIDNDPGMIEHMKKFYAPPQVVEVLESAGNGERTLKVGGGDFLSPPLEWLVYDIVENVGALNSEIENFTGSFDLVVDKGTFDAVVTEGAVFTMLADVHRLLRYGGAYLLCSIRKPALLDALLRVPILGWDVSLHDPVKGQVARGESGISTDGYTIVICRKVPKTVSVSASHVDGMLTAVELQELQKQEKEVMDTFFQKSSPLLTPEFERSIRTRFATALSGSKKKVSSNSASYVEHVLKLSLRDCYEVMFPSISASSSFKVGSQGVVLDELCEMDYPFELFMEDIEGFKEDSGEGSFDLAIQFAGTHWNVEQCLEFLRVMQ